MIALVLQCPGKHQTRLRFRCVGWIPSKPTPHQAKRPDAQRRLPRTRCSEISAATHPHPKIGELIEDLHVELIVLLGVQLRRAKLPQNVAGVPQPLFEIFIVLDTFRREERHTSNNQLQENGGFQRSTIFGGSKHRRTNGGRNQDYFELRTKIY